MFADGAYEVVRYFGGRGFALGKHADRLRESLAAIRIEPPGDVERFAGVSDELVACNGLADAELYWQVTRGSGPRGHLFVAGARATVLVIAYPSRALVVGGEPKGVVVVLREDLRWHRCSIKSLMLLANVLAKNEAHEAGADEAILHRDEVVTEGTSTSVFVVRGGELWTHPADQWILGGITRAIVLDVARAEGMVVRERAFTTHELLTANEVMITGTTTYLAGVLRADDAVIGGGQVGPVTRRLHAGLVGRIAGECGLGG